MFESGLKEEREGRIVIQEMEPKTLKLLLDGIYLGKLSSEDIPELGDLIDLFKAAHRYCIDGLRDWTVAQIGQKIDVENALEVFSLTSIYEDEKLRAKALEFVKK